MSQVCAARSIAAELPDFGEGGQLHSGQPPHPPEANELRFDGLRIEPTSRRVFVDDREVTLTRSEFDLLMTLATSSGAVVSPNAIFEALRAAPLVGDGHAVEVQISRLRQKLGESSQRQRFIRTVRGLGYRFDAVSQGPSVSLVYDTQLRVTGIQPSDRPFFGWEPDDILGKFFLMAAGPVGDMSQDDAIAMMHAVASVGPQVSTLTYEVRCADGSTVLRNAVVEIFKDEQGSFSGARTTIV